MFFDGTKLAPGSEQGVGVLVQGIQIKGRRHSALAGLTFVLMTQQIFIGNDVRPMMATGVMHAQQNLAETGQPGQGLKRLSRQ